MNKKRKGGWMVLLGLLCLLAALGLTVRDMLQEQQSNQAADEARQELSQHMPYVTAQPDASATPGLQLTDQQGRTVDWPMDADGMLIPWPVTEQGQPLPQVTDALGHTYRWDPLDDRPVLVPITETPAPSDRPDTAPPTVSPCATGIPQTSTPVPSTPSAAPLLPATDLPATDQPSAWPVTASPSTGPSPSPAPSIPAALTTDSPSAAPTHPAPSEPSALSTPTHQAPGLLPAASPSAATSQWNVSADGSLMPYVSDGHGVVLPWMTDGSGTPLSLNTLDAMWDELIAQLSLNLKDLLHKPAFVLDPHMEMPTIRLHDGYDYIGILDIPSQKISLSIMADWSYTKLRITPCLWVGSIYAGDAIIAGHNNSRHLTAIKRLNIGDEVLFTDVDGNVFHYSVIGTQTINGDDVDTMVAGSDEWDLTLFTCSHSSTKRYTVRCRLDRYTLPDDR